MPRTPKYCAHRATGRGYSRFPSPAPPPRYLTVYWPGALDSPESLAAYHAAIHQYHATGRVPGYEPPAGGAVVGELVAQFWRHVERQGAYTKAGKPTSSRNGLRAAFRALVDLYGDEPVAAIDLQRMETLAAHMAAKGWAVSTVREYLAKVRGLLRWAEARRLVPAGAAAAATPSRGLAGSRGRVGRPTARRQPPDLYAVGAVALAAGPPVCSMIWLQVLNGMRPAGVCALRPCDVDRTGPLWLYVEPPEAAAKTGTERHWLGPRARGVLSPYLDSAPALDVPVFKPTLRPWLSRGYTPDYYCQVVTDWCQRLGVQRFTPHLLRHHHATVVDRLYGREAARDRLGHATARTTEIYAHTGGELARRVASEIG